MENLKKKYFKEQQLLVIPRKEKNKRELFTYLASFFEFDKEYSEDEVNQMILEYYADYSLIRRYLVDYDFLGRDKYGTRYYRKN